MRGCGEGTLVWVRDTQRVWVAGEVISVQSVNSSDVFTIHTEDGQDVQVKSDKDIHLRNPEHYGAEGRGGVDDLTQLTHLHEPAILHSLALRFDVDKIYTYTGPILIAVNPFKSLPLYSREHLHMYRHDASGMLGPHVYAIASSAYRNLVSDRRSQSILISGESGAGKTESTKFVMEFLAVAGGRSTHASHAQPQLDKGYIEQQVLESNPLLEAFGNARTLRNDNSSRFGKFIELQFSTDGVLVGARIHTYLLEKVRLVDQAKGERCFHIFYQLCSQRNDPRFSSLCLKSASETGYLKSSNCFVLPGVDDAEQFQRTERAMEIVGIPLEDRLELFRILGALLHMGDLQFLPCTDNEDASRVDPATDSSLNLVANLLGLDVDRFHDSLCNRRIAVAGQQLTVPLKVDQALDSRDALTRAVYGKLFLWLVHRINESIGFDPRVNLMVGVLDIFGFECFQRNSFEQLCINYANERLQQQFNNFVFKLEQDLYIREQVPWDMMDFPDNQDCVELIDARHSGVLALLDEECLMPRGNDKSFVGKLSSSQGNHVRFRKVRTDEVCFVISHYAGDVTYDARGFCDKNKDLLHPDLIQLVSNSESSLIRVMFQDPRVPTPDSSPTDSQDQTPSRRASSLVSSSLGIQFKSQLSLLMTIIDQTTPHYIRCIKSNPQSVSDLLDRVSVVNQLRCGGVLEAVKVSRAGFPVRFTHWEFFIKFYFLVPLQDLLSRLPFLHESNPTLIQPVNSGKSVQNLNRRRLSPLWSFTAITVSAADAKTACNVLLEILRPLVSLDEKACVIGQSRVFFRAGKFEPIEKKRLQMLTAKAVQISKHMRGWWARRRYLYIRRKAIQVQSSVRTWSAKRLRVSLRRERAAVKLQTHVRRCQALWRYQAFRWALVRLQARFRSRVACKQVQELQAARAALVIQRQFKKYRCRESYCELKRVTIRAQCLMRRKIARRQLTALRIESRQTSTWVRKAEELESQLNHFKQLLENESALRKQLETQLNQLLSGRGVELGAPFIAQMGTATSAETAAQTDSPARKYDSNHVELIADASSTRDDLTGESKSYKRDVEPDVEIGPSVGAESLVEQLRLLAEERDRYQLDAVESQQRLKLETRKSNILLRELRARLSEEAMEAVEQILQPLNYKGSDRKLSADSACESLRIERVSLSECLSPAATVSGLLTPTPAKYLPSSALESSHMSHMPQIELFNHDMESSPTELDSSVDRKETSLVHEESFEANQDSSQVRDIDVLLVGESGIGKTHLIQVYMSQNGVESSPAKSPLPYSKSGSSLFSSFVPSPSVLPSPNQGDSAGSGLEPTIGVEAHVVNISSQDNAANKLRIIDSSGQVRYRQFARRYYGRSRWVLVVFDVTRRDTFMRCSDWLQELANSGASVMLLGNTWASESGLRQREVPVHESKLLAAQNCALAMETSRLEDALEIVEKDMPVLYNPSPPPPPVADPKPSRWGALFRKRQNPQPDSTPPLQPTVSSKRSQSFVTPVRQGVRSFLGFGSGSSSSSNQEESNAPVPAQPRICEPLYRLATNKHGLEVSIIRFSSHSVYETVLACGLVDGSISVYAFAGMTERNNGTAEGSVTTLATGPTKHGVPGLLVWLPGHTQRVTCLDWSTENDLHLLSTSADGTTRLWNIEKQECLRLFNDTYPTVSAVMFPRNSNMFVRCSERGVIHVVNVSTGHVTQKLHADAASAALAFDTHGTKLYVGTMVGTVHVFDYSPTAKTALTHNEKSYTVVSRGTAISSITYVSRVSGESNLLINSLDNAVSLFTHLPDGRLVPIRRYQVPSIHKMIRSCFCHRTGSIISGSEDGRLHCFKVDSSQLDPVLVSGHNASVLGVVLNEGESMLGSCDESGDVMIWQPIYDEC